MAARRASARLSAGEQELIKGVNGPKRKSAMGAREGDELSGEPTPKKRKQAPKKLPAFKPQLIPLTNSSDTPPDDIDEPLSLGAPPSERKIARRRESTRAYRERPQSVSPPPAMVIQSGPVVGTDAVQIVRKGREGSRGKSVGPVRAAANTSDDPLAGVEETSSMRSSTAVHPVEHLQFSKASRPRPSAPRPSSPPRRTFGPSGSSAVASSSRSLASSTMGPPTGFVRKTRKSIRGFQDLSKESVVPLAQSETPVIRKNQELRGGQARRSSLDHRGGRASSSWGKGEITMPHKSVDAKLFYRHIPTAYPDPIKTRMLLVWCANRAVDDALRPASSSTNKGKAREKEERSEEGDRLINGIMEDFVQKMNKGVISTDTLSKPSQDNIVSGLKPHSRNVVNRQVEASTNALIKKHKEESAQWSALVHAANSKQTEVIRQLEKKRLLSTPAEPDLNNAEDWMRQAAELADRVIAEGEGDLSAIGEFVDVEYKVDTLLQTSHVALQYTLQATRFLDGIFSSLTADLRARDRLGLPSQLPQHQGDGPDTISLLSTVRSTSTTLGATESQTGSKRKAGDAMSLLRALASTESRNQSDDTVAAAAKVAPMPAMATSMTPRRPTTGMTPRRLGPGGLIPGTTPRRGYGKAAPAGAE